MYKISSFVLLGANGTCNKTFLKYPNIMHSFVWKYSLCFFQNYSNFWNNAILTHVRKVIKKPPSNSVSTRQNIGKWYMVCKILIANNMSKLSPIKCIRGKSFSGTVSVLLLFWNHDLKERAQPHWVILEARKRKEVIRFW